MSQVEKFTPSLVWQAVVKTGTLNTVYKLTFALHNISAYETEGLLSWDLSLPPRDHIVFMYKYPKLKKKSEISTSGPSLSDKRNSTHADIY